LLAGPLAALAWLGAERRWRESLVLLLGIAGMTMGLFAALNLLTAGGFAFHTLAANLNQFSFARAAAFYLRLIEQMPVLLLAVVAFLIARGPKSGARTLAGPYLAGAMLGALTIGKIGSDWNYFLELAAGCGLVAGLWVARFGTQGWVSRCAALALALQAAYGWWVMEREIMAPRRHLLHGERASWEQLKRVVDEAPGPVLTDSGMGFLPLKGKPIYYQCFEMSQLVRAGRWDDARLVRSIENREFPVVVLNLAPPVLAERWTPAVLDAIARNYEGTEKIIRGRRVDGVLRPIAR
jgi:uncharacterized membrane protein